MKTLITLLLAVGLSVSAQAEDGYDLDETGWLTFNGAWESTLLAQADDPEHSRGRGSEEGHGRKRGGRHLEQLRLLKLLEVLDLSEEQETGFITKFHRLQRDMRQIEQQRREVVAQLADGLAQESLADDTIRKLADSVMVLEQVRGSRMQRFVAAVEDDLTAQQLGKLIVFHERFEAEMLKHLREFRGRRQDVKPPWFEGDNDNP